MYFSFNSWSSKVDIVNFKRISYDMKIICSSMGGHRKLLYIYVAAENISKAKCPPNIPSLNLEANINFIFY